MLSKSLEESSEDVVPVEKATIASSKQTAPNLDEVSDQDAVVSIPATTSTMTDTNPAAANVTSNPPTTSTDNNQTADPEATAPDTRPNHSVFSPSTKKLIVMMTLLGSIFSPLSGTIYLPAIPTLAHTLHEPIARINLTVTSYMILQGVAPMFFGDLADSAGRRPVYVLSFAIYVCANIGLALQNNYAALVVLRALQSTGSSATIALGNGVVADVMTSAERGGYIGLVSSGMQFGFALAPTLGGVLTTFLGWRAIFWFLVISSVLYMLSYVAFVPETGRKIVGNGSIRAHGWHKPLLTHLKERVARSKGPEEPGKETLRLARPETPKLRFPNPFNCLRLIVEKDVFLVLFFIAIIVTGMQCLLVSLPSTLQPIYAFNDLQVGLCYIPICVGAAVGSMAGGKTLDWNYRRVARANGFSVDKKRGDDLRHFPLERARLSVVFYPVALAVAMIVAWGWTLHARTTLAAPLIVSFFGGLGFSAATSMVTTLLVDLYPKSPSTASAAGNLTRCTMSAAGTAVIQYMIDTMGVGWCYTFLGLVVLAFSPLLWVVMKWGPGWREERSLREEEKEKLEEAKLDKEREEERHERDTEVEVEVKLKEKES